MGKNKYETERSTDNTVYKFTSSGRSGEIVKIVHYELLDTTIGDAPVYNLAMGDEMANGDFDDKSVTNNGDMVKVISTITSTVQEFTSAYPDAYVLIEGNSDQKTYLYNRALSTSYEMFNKNYAMYGLDEDNNMWEYDPKVKYAKFLLKKK